MATNQGGNFFSCKSSKGFGGGAMDQDIDFDEDFWGVTNDKGGSSSAWHKASSPSKILKANNNALPSNNAQVVQGSSSSSVPIDIPDWSKIYGKKYCKKGSKNGGVRSNDDDDDDDGDNDDMSIPPHEWLARKLARNQISSFSVCEGMGRTLKGRDLSKVRNTILTKTGFIE
ncbi:hypothetical protein TanjilG_06807 [Lupinus angustifolius]|uniref:Senescence regulator S40 n=1 Tax=Lupinus angustifolius TaxID=3871 RepID=A0A1J7G622_LUPAN|nr:PREDICTED: uncharacterized protein LOC109329530 [Lupinus angustifolius]OIV95831.1 hypothetical protein TanjilG_06807 [Lupinus angustifolius]